MFEGLQDGRFISVGVYGRLKCLRGCRPVGQPLLFPVIKMNDHLGEFG